MALSLGQAAMAALERENELLRQELAAAKEREKWFQNQIDQIQQRLLPPAIIVDGRTDYLYFFG